jgi:cysteine desulfurase/selenocysteine lyase
MTRTHDTAAPFDVERIRAEFPALGQEIRGRPFVYLDNAATTQKPRAVLDAVTRYYERDNANVHRGVHTLSDRATRAYEGARERVRRFLGAGSREEIVFVRGTTEAINLVAASFVRPRLTPGDEVLVSHMEHHSNIVPWQLVCEAAGARLRVVPIDDRGVLRMDVYESLLGPNTRLVAMVHVSNALGTVNPVREIVDRAHARGIPVLIDGAQAVPHMPVDVRAIGCDFFAISGHKMFAPTGIGALWARRELLETMPPWHGGGDMIRSVTFEKSIWNDLPHRFEAGTPNVGGAVGLAAAIDWLERIGLERVAAHDADLLAFATERLSSIDGLRIVGTAPDKAGALSFVLDDIHPHDLGTIVDHEGIAIRTGHHCAQPVMDRFGVPATARASFAIYNTRADIEALVRAIHKARDVFG